MRGPSPDGYEDGPAARPGAARLAESSPLLTCPRPRPRSPAPAERQFALFGQQDLTLNAQSHLVGYYWVGCGFSVSGPGFLEDGIPHVPMHRPGSPGA